MGKKLVLKTPEVSEKTIDVALMIFGVAVIAYALYLGGVFNGRNAKIIEFPGNKNTGANPETASNGDKTE